MRASLAWSCLTAAGTCGSSWRMRTTARSSPRRSSSWSFRPDSRPRTRAGASWTSGCAASPRNRLGVARSDAGVRERPHNDPPASAWSADGEPDASLLHDVHQPVAGYLRGECADGDGHTRRKARHPHAAMARVRPAKRTASSSARLPSSSARAPRRSRTTSGTAIVLGCRSGAVSSGSTSRLARCGPSRIEGGTPIRACGPVDAPRVHEGLFQTLLDHLPYDTRDVDWLRRHRAQFTRYENRE